MSGQNGLAFGTSLLWRVVSVVGLLLAATMLALTGGLYASATVAGLLSLLLFTDLCRHAGRPAAEALSFADAIVYADYARHWRAEGRPSCLAQRMNAAMARLREAGTAQQRRANYLAALIDVVPTALIELAPEGVVTPLNPAGRRLTGPARDLVALEEALPGAREAIAALRPGASAVLTAANGARHLATSVGWTAGNAARTLLAIEDVEHPLGRAEAQAWADLVRLLAHEIMNSLTPVTALAAAMGPMLDEVEAGQGIEALLELRLAVDAIGRRASGLQSFVQRYREMAQTPEARPELIPAAQLARRLETLFAPSVRARGGRFETRVVPPGLVLRIDPDLIDQALINLVKNALEAVPPAAAPHVLFTASAEPSGDPCLSVEDGGPGLSREAVGQVFLPFFTTKPDGSGIGLTLVRQAALAHGGRAEVGVSAWGGAQFTLRLPMAAVVEVAPESETSV